jgi:xanthine/CO dehydrogenase XdhC/CoxF family maturation factor
VALIFLSLAFLPLTYSVLAVIGLVLLFILIDALGNRILFKMSVRNVIRRQSTTALVLVAHDYKYDLPVLRHALGTPVGYIGLLGSTRRGAAILNLLREDGVGEEALARVRVPIGLDLGAQSAPEIALSILAEALAAQRNATGMPISEKVRRGLK